MLSAFQLGLILIILFLLDHIFIALVNPATLTESPSTDDSMDLINQFVGRAIAIFAIVLLIIQFILDNSSITYYEEFTLFILTMSGGFLMLTFILELFSDFRIILFRLQLNSLRYSGLLLFLGLFFLLKSNDISEFIEIIFLFFLAISWLIWLIHEIHYIYKTQRKEWNNKNKSRRKWLIEYIHKLKIWIKSQFSKDVQYMNSTRPELVEDDTWSFHRGREILEDKGLIEELPAIAQAYNKYGGGNQNMSGRSEIIDPLDWEQEISIKFVSSNCDGSASRCASFDAYKDSVVVEHESGEQMRANWHLMNMEAAYRDPRGFTGDRSVDVGVLLIPSDASFLGLNRTENDVHAVLSNYFGFSVPLFVWQYPTN